MEMRCFGGGLLGGGGGLSVVTAQASSRGVATLEMSKRWTVVYYYLLLVEDVGYPTKGECLHRHIEDKLVQGHIHKVIGIVVQVDGHPTC